ncbi:MAG: TIGR03617 family F420-dependent LLM class oxidoreductase [Pseudomonadota bacterium]
MKITTGVPLTNLNKVAAATQQVEAQGYDGISTQENRQDPFLPLAIAATNSHNIELATGIAISFARSPMVFANIGWDLQRASNGRFVLGLGTQVKGHNERRFSVPWTAPAPRMRELVTVIKAIWANWKHQEPLDFAGEHYRVNLMPPNFVPEPCDHAPPPITIAAVGPGMMKVAAEVCDGVRLHPFSTRQYLEEVALPRLEAGIPAGQREHFEISGGGFVATGATDEAVARAFEWVRMRVGFYGSTRAYWPVFASHGLEDLGEKLNHMSKTNQWEQMTREISDDVVHLFAAVGRHDELASAVQQRFGGLSDSLSVGTPVDEPGGLPTDLIQDLQRIPSVFKGFSG